MAKLSRNEMRRIEAVNAAAVAFGSEGYTEVEQLWSLCVFFELFIRDGGDGTLEKFGPKEQTATVVSLVK